MPIPIPVIALMVIILLVGVVIIINGGKPQREQKLAKERLNKQAYKFLSSFFLTQGQMFKISAQLSALSIYSRTELQALTTKYMLLTSAISGGLVLASIFLFHDTISTLICIAFSLLVNNVLVGKQIEKVNLQVYKSLKHSISAIRQEYMRLGSVAEAIAEADIHPLLNRPFEEVHSILTGAHGELRLLKFYESSPFRSLQTLAGICFNIHNYGDDKDEYGQSNFIQALTMLTSDVNSEIQRLITMKNKFGVIEYLPFVPILAIGFIENYFIGIMPGTALIYNGILGYVGRVVILTSCILSYSIVANINSAASVKEDDRAPWITDLLQRSGFRQFIYNITPKNARGKRIDRRLKASLSRKSIEHLYTEKVIWASLALVLGIIACTSTVSLSRDFIMNSTQQLSLVSSNDMDKFSKEQILTLDYSYFNRTKDWSKEEFDTNIKGAMPGLTDLQIIDQVKRLKDKEGSLNASFFHWYYMLICIVISLLAWSGPNILLSIRKFLVQTEAEDDFLQLQTLIAILMNTEIDTLDTLWQLCQHSRIHRNMLIYCYHSYPSNPEKELVRLQSKTPLIEFKRFIGKLLLTISDLSLREAFSDLKIERDHMIRIREINMYATIDKKRGLCGPISMAPMGLLVVFELLIPLGYLGIKEFMGALSGMK